MIECDGQKILKFCIVDCWKMQFAIKIKVLRETPKQAD